MPDPAYDLPDLPEVEYEVHLPNHLDVFRDWALATLTREALPGGGDYLYFPTGEVADAARERLERLWTSTWDGFVTGTRSEDGVASLLVQKAYLEARAVLPEGEEDDGSGRWDAHSVARFRLGVLRVVLDLLGRDGRVRRWDEMGAFRNRLWPTLRRPPGLKYAAAAYLRAAEELYERYVVRDPMPAMDLGDLYRRIRARASAIDPEGGVEDGGDAEDPGEAVRSAFRRLQLDGSPNGEEAAMAAAEVVLRRAHAKYVELFIGA